MIRIVGLVLILTLPLAGCAGPTDTQRRAATILGAAGGAAIGAMAGNAARGTAIGAGVGFLGGLIYDQSQKAYEQGLADGQAGR